jgi:hypothetical protein
VAASNGTHPDDLSFNQFHPVVFGEDARRAHAVIFVNIEMMSFDLD